MKKTLSYICLLLTFAGCTKDEFSADANSYELILNLVISDDASSEIESLDSVIITAYNSNKDYSLYAYSDSSGEVVFSDMEAGVYSITTSYEIEADGVSIVLNGSTNLTLITDQSDDFELESTLVQNDGSGFVIREFYYSGCLTVAGNQYLDDQYIEVYNNSSDTLNADSILLIEHGSYGNETNYWSSIQDDSIVVKMIWALPESDYGHLIPPGTGYIMARDPMNHQSDANGNPNSPVDLADADFDFYSDKTTTKDIDYDPPNMVAELWTFKGNDVVFHSRGGSAIALVKIPEDIDTYISNNLVTKGTSSSDYYCKIPNEWVIDAVEVVWNDKIYKRFDNSLDAGYTYVAAGAKSGLCVRRVIKRFIGSRAVYQDTDNSSNDFEHDVTPQPWVYE